MMLTMSDKLVRVFHEEEFQLAVISLWQKFTKYKYKNVINALYVDEICSPFSCALLEFFEFLGHSCYPFTHIFRVVSLTLGPL